MINKCIILVINVLVLYCVLAKCIPVDKNTEVPIERSGIHFSYGFSPVQMFATRQLPTNKMPGHLVLHTLQPAVHFYHAVPHTSHIGYVNPAQNPAYVAVLNNPMIKTGYDFMFSSPHHVKFHDFHEQQEAKMEFMNTQVQIDNLQGQFEDFIMKQNGFRPENFQGHTGGEKLLVNTVESVTADTTASTQATTQKSTMITSKPQGNENKMEGVKPGLLNVEILQGKLEDFIQKDSPPFVNSQTTENLNGDVTEATTLRVTEAATITASSTTQETRRGDVEYDIDIRKDDE